MERKRKQLMEDSDLYNQADMDLANNEHNDKHKFGDIKGVQVGDAWSKRSECANAGVHIAPYAGIVGNSRGAYSICLSGAYEDKDEGEHILYCGTGGIGSTGIFPHWQNPDQSFEHPQNKSLQQSLATGKPVRVIRGPNPQSIYAPESGYRYDGLYTVTKAYYGTNQSGHRICLFELTRMEGQPPLPTKTPQ